MVRCRWTQNRVDSLLFGVIIALLFHFMPQVYASIAKRVLPLIAVSLAGVAFVLLVPERSFFRGPGFSVIYIACGAFLILVMEHSGRFTGWWIYRAIAKLGIYSYALYLWHTTMLGTGEKIVARYPALPAWFLALGVQFAGAVALAYITTRLVEWPALYLRESIHWLQDSKPLSRLATEPSKVSMDEDGSLQMPVIVEQGAE